MQVSILSYPINDSQWIMALNMTDYVSKIGVVVDLNCKQNVHFLKWAMEFDVFMYSGLSWLLLQQDKPNLNSLSKIINTNNSLLPYLITKRVDITVASLNLCERNCFIPLYNLNTLFNIFKGNESHLISLDAAEKKGQWSQHGLEITNKKPWDRLNLTGLTINITSVSYLSTQQNRQMFDRTVLLLLKHILNFRLYMVKDPHMFKSKDLSILHQLSNGRVDLGASTVLITQDRIGLADYSVAIDKFRPNLYYKVQSVRAARNIYVLPFSPDVWVSLVSLLLAITVALTFILGSETRLPNGMSTTSANTENSGGSSTNTGNNSDNSQKVADAKKHIDAQQQPYWDLSEVMLVTFGAVSQQGSARDPTTSAARTLFITLFVLAVLMYTAYSASVISLMSSAQPVTNSLHGILQDGTNMGLALHNNHYYHTQFKDEPNPVSNKLHELKEAPSFLNLQDGLDSTVQGCLAFSADRVDAYTYLHGSQQSEDALCSVGEIPLLQGPGYHRAFALRRNSAYTRAINQGLIRLLEHGLVERERHRRFILQPLCQSADAAAGSAFISIALDDISPALYLVGCGAVFSLILLPLELAVHYCVSQIKKRYEPLHGNQQTMWPIVQRKPPQQKKYDGHRSRNTWTKFKRLVQTGTTNLPFIH